MKSFINCTLCSVIIRVIKVKMIIIWSRTCNMHAYKILVVKLEVKKPLVGRSVCRWKDNIKVDLMR
jgi:hypothetical protein